MGGKGQSKFTYRKHTLLQELAEAQIAIARLPQVLGPETRAALIDLTAGDGEGVTTDTPVLPGLPFEARSLATPSILMRCSGMLADRGRSSTIILCERSRTTRAKLQAGFGSRAEILKNCRQLLNLRANQYDYGLIIADPNGPKDTNVDVLQHLSSIIPKADFLVVVNESAILRHHGLKPADQQKHANVKGPARTRDRYLWQLEPTSWLRMLKRKHILISRRRFGGKAMQGRILLVTNFAHRASSNFDHVIDATAGMATAHAAASAPRQPPLRAAERDRRADSRTVGSLGI
jgi:hypothetical protein